MNFPIDGLILILGIVGFLALFGGCLIVAGYLVCTHLAARPTPGETPPDDNLAGFPPGTRWSIHLLVVLLGGALLSVQSVLWLWHVVAPARPAVLGAVVEPWRVDLFPWQ